METLLEEDISTLSIKVSEKIENKNLSQFLRSSIENSNISLSPNTHYYFFYSEENFTYEIILFMKNSKEIKSEPFLLLQKYYKTDDTVKVILSDTYFLVIKNDKILTLKKMQKIDKAEISLYIQQIYKINKFEIIETTKESLESLQEMCVSSSFLKYYPLYPKKSFYYFLLFCICNLVFLSIMIYFEYKDNDKSPTNQLTKSIKNTALDNKNISKTLELFRHIESKNIFIETIKYSHKKIKTTLYHNSKSQLLNFASIVASNIEVKSLKYNETKNLYSMEVTLEY